MVARRDAQEKHMQFKLRVCPRCGKHAMLIRNDCALEQYAFSEEFMSVAGGLFFLARTAQAYNLEADEIARLTQEIEGSGMPNHLMDSDTGELVISVITWLTVQFMVDGDQSDDEISAWLSDECELDPETIAAMRSELTTPNDGCALVISTCPPDTFEELASELVEVGNVENVIPLAPRAPAAQVWDLPTDGDGDSLDLERLMGMAAVGDG